MISEVKNIGEIKEFISSGNSFGVVCHKNPDGDTLGAGLAMSLALKKIGKKCSIYCTDVPDSVFISILGVNDVKPISEICEDNLIFCDCADEARAEFTLDLNKFKTLNIDHHISNTKFCDINVVYDDFSATCMIVYYIITGLGIELDSNIAKCLYVGVCTDTNNFTNSNVNSDTFYVASKLAEHDFDISGIVKAIFKIKSFAKTKAIALFIDRIKMLFDGKLCISYLTIDDINALQLESTEGLVDVGLNIEGVSVAVFLKEIEPKVYKISMRSNFDVDVCKICAAFGGGGHVKAAGAQIAGNTEDVIDKVCNEVAKWME